jgi:hypothetical protein
MTLIEASSRCRDTRIPGILCRRDDGGSTPNKGDDAEISIADHVGHLLPTLAPCGPTGARCYLRSPPSGTGRALRRGGAPAPGRPIRQLPQVAVAVRSSRRVRPQIRRMRRAFRRIFHPARLPRATSAVAEHLVRLLLLTRGAQLIDRQNFSRHFALPLRRPRHFRGRGGLIRRRASAVSPPMCKRTAAAARVWRPSGDKIVGSGSSSSACGSASGVPYRYVSR